MNYEEALSRLMARYGNTAILTFTTIFFVDGERRISITAHGNGQCASASSYQGALAELEAKTTGDISKPPRIATMCDDCKRPIDRCNCDAQYESMRDQERGM